MACVQVKLDSVFTPVKTYNSNAILAQETVQLHSRNRFMNYAALAEVYGEQGRKSFGNQGLGRRMKLVVKE